MSESKKLELGIEIVSAMKASEGVNPELWESFSDEQKRLFGTLNQQETERLHKQALYVAEVTLAKLGDMMWLKY